MHVLVVGSSVIDLFLSISPSHFNVESGKLELALGDKIPTEVKTFALGGNATNISVGLTRLGVPSTLYTYLGKDILSRQIEEKVTAEGVELIAERELTESSPLHLIFDFKQDRIIFSNYPKADHSFDKSRVGAFDFIFLNSISDVWEHAYKNVLAYAAEQSVPFAFSPGSRQLDSINDVVLTAVRKCEIFFSNKEEAQKILTAVGKPATEMRGILNNLSDIGPKIVSVTDGKNGGYARDTKGNMFHAASFNPDLVSEDKTGAGDGYASGFFAAYLLGKDIKTAMMWGSVNAHSVMGKIGAQNGLLTPDVLQSMLEAKPDFQVQAL